MFTLCLLTTLYFGPVDETSHYVDLTHTCTQVSAAMLRHFTDACERESIDRCEVIIEREKDTGEVTYTIETKLSTEATK